MSDKPEMVSVPRELLEKALKADASQGATAMDLHHGWLAMKVLRHALNQELAAPAEDVRAVVAEPVAILKRGPLIPLSARFLNAALELPIGNHPLYRHPQRPVVMPERHQYPTNSYVCGWNACLDEFARLSK